VPPVPARHAVRRERSRTRALPGHTRRCRPYGRSPLYCTSARAGPFGRAARVTGLTDPGARAPRSGSPSRPRRVRPMGPVAHGPPAGSPGPHRGRVPAVCPHDRCAVPAGGTPGDLLGLGRHTWTDRAAPRPGRLRAPQGSGPPLPVPEAGCPNRCPKEPFQRVFCCTMGQTCLACGGIHDPQHATKGCEGPVGPPGWRAACSRAAHTVLGAMHGPPSSARWCATPCAHTATRADGIAGEC